MKALLPQFRKAARDVTIRGVVAEVGHFLPAYTFVVVEGSGADAFLAYRLCCGALVIYTHAGLSMSCAVGLLAAAGGTYFVFAARSTGVFICQNRVKEYQKKQSLASKKTSSHCDEPCLCMACAPLYPHITDFHIYAVVHSHTWVYFVFT